MACVEYITLINRFWDSATTNPLSTGQVSLYFALLHVCNRSNWTEWFQAPNQVLSVLTGLSRSGILKARNELKQRGMIDFRERSTKSTIYKLSTISTLSTTMSNSTQVGTQVGNQIGVQNGVQKGNQIGVQKSDTKERYRYRQDNKKSISNEILEKCAQNSAGAIPQDTLDRYIASMEALGKPMTPSSLDMLFKRLEKLAPGDKETQTAIMEQTIGKRWLDVYPLRDDGGKTVKSKPNAFHNFEQRDTDYNALVLERLNERLREGEET